MRIVPKRRSGDRARAAAEGRPGPRRCLAEQLAVPAGETARLADPPLAGEDGDRGRRLRRRGEILADAMEAQPADVEGWRLFQALGEDPKECPARRPGGGHCVYGDRLVEMRGDERPGAVVDDRGEEVGPEACVAAGTGVANSRRADGSAFPQGRGRRTRGPAARPPAQAARASASRWHSGLPAGSGRRARPRRERCRSPRSPPRRASAGSRPGRRGRCRPSPASPRAAPRGRRRRRCCRCRKGCHRPPRRRGSRSPRPLKAAPPRGRRPARHPAAPRSRRRPRNSMRPRRPPARAGRHERSGPQVRPVGSGAPCPSAIDPSGNSTTSTDPRRTEGSPRHDCGLSHPGPAPRTAATATP
jgi:hypothetical protein